MPAEHSIRFQRQRRRIADLVRIHACDRAAGNISRDIAASAHRVQADTPQFLEHLWKSLDRDPVQLNVLPHCKIGDAAGVAAGQAGNGSQLVRSQQAVRNADPQHEERQRQPLAVLAADNPRTIALRVDSPPAEVGSDPFRRNRAKAFSREASNLSQPLPGIHGALQALHFLRFRFFDRIRYRWIGHRMTSRKLIRA